MILVGEVVVEVGIEGCGVEDGVSERGVDDYSYLYNA